MFALFSEEPVDLRRKKPIQSISGVVYERNSKGKSVFYTIEHKITDKGFAYSIKNGSKVLQTIGRDSKLSLSALAAPGDPTEKCDMYRKNYIDTRAVLAAAANQTCQRQHDCVPLCMPEDNPNSIIMVLIFEDPTSWRCMVRKPRDYGFTFFNREDLGDGDDIVLTAIDSVIQHQSALYDPIPIPRR